MSSATDQAQAQALDAPLKPADKANDSNNATMAASQWESNGFHKSISAMQPADSSAGVLPNLTIDNTGSGNVTINFNSSGSDRGNSDGNNPLSGMSARLQQAEAPGGALSSIAPELLKNLNGDMQSLQNDFGKFQGDLNQLTGKDNTGTTLGGTANQGDKGTHSCGTDNTGNTGTTPGGADNTGNTGTTPAGTDNTGNTGTTPAGTDNTGNTGTTPAGTDNTGNPITTPAGIDNTGNTGTTPAGTDNTGNPITTPAGTDNTGNPITTPAEVTPPVVTAPGVATGNFSVQNGKIMGPDGQPFVAKGVAVYAADAANQAQAIFAATPNLNFIRLAATPSTDSPASVQAAIQAIHALNPQAVVEVEDHTSPGTDGTTSNVLSGDALTAETNWYAQIAAANKDNPYVWYGTANEPNNPGDQQAVVNQETAIYNSVRGAGAQNMMMLESAGGWDSSPMQANPGAYANMSNVAWDVHYYGWKSNGSTSLADNVNALQQMVGSFNGITEAGGQAMPVLVGEYGNSTTGQGVDNNGTAAVDAVQTATNQGIVQGAVAWVWDGGNNPGGDSITQDGTMNTLTPYGQEIINYNNTGATGPAN
jgi:hypothetical protein